MGGIIIYDNLANSVFFEPLREGMDELWILSGYATPNMASWLIKNIQSITTKKIKISLIVGMVPHDGLSVSVHEGFRELVNNGGFVESLTFQCSYVYERPPVHSKLYIWLKNGLPLYAFTGSANFTQSAFGTSKREYMIACNSFEAFEAWKYYRMIEEHTIYCNHSEVEDYIILRPIHPILDMENNPQNSLEGAGVESVTLSLLARNGETGIKSGLNWGQRSYRNRNEAYIGLSAYIARSGFFPLNEQHFTAVTDDGHQLILRVEQQNDKAITTPLSNAQLGEYFRKRLNKPNGEYIWRSDLEVYGRTDVTFYKLDDEQYYMDFSINNRSLL